mmetsp:Transcript_39178/g.155394  ORF Transcript_39178/g.155394 Transcript_39178/m.155394 type:complete len:319 (-) Transcript_39178:1329-2285(-)
MQKDMEAADVTTSGLGTSIVEDAVPAAPVISADALKRRDLILESLRDETRSRVAEKEAEEMTRANRELDLRASRMNAERQFMEESEVEFRRKISQLTDLSAAQQKFDQEHRGDLRAKLDEVAMQQAKYEQEFQGDYKRSVDELATHLNQLDTEIGQMSEVNALAKTAVAAEKSPQPSPVELQLEEADGATILAAATAAEANDAAQDAVVKTSQINEILGDTSKLVLEVRLNSLDREAFKRLRLPLLICHSPVLQRAQSRRRPPWPLVLRTTLVPSSHRSRRELCESTKLKCLPISKALRRESGWICLTSSKLWRCTRV